MSVPQNVIVRTLMRDRAKLLAYIWSIVHDGHIAEDVLQDVSVIAVEKREQIENEAVLAAWLRTTARHRALYALRQGRSKPLTLDAGVLDQLEGEWAERDAVPTNRLMDALRECLSHLTPHARRIIDLRYMRSCSSQQIAADLGLSVAAVYKTTTRAHAALSDCVRERMSHE
ncbi:MAG: sigma-70 family RNA polymerase sigma factor [Planctomycetes bacterium]|nr:sigma-70 family RNA polymerase sigma factor [Planctomycetota bacterium]